MPFEAAVGGWLGKPWQNEQFFWYTSAPRRRSEAENVFTSLLGSFALDAGVHAAARDHLFEGHRRVCGGDGR